MTFYSLRAVIFTEGRAMTMIAEKQRFAGPLDATDRCAVTKLRQVLIAHGFHGAAVPTAMGSPLNDGKFHLRNDQPLYLRRLQPATPLNVLIKLFVLDQWIDPAAVSAALYPLSIDDASRMGLIEESARGIHARVRLSAYRDLLLAHDRFDEESASLSRDYVLDVNPTTLTIESLTVRRRVRSTLDLGTGCGVLALLAARHSDRVVAVDTNPRALNFAAFNAALNGYDHVECRLGSLFEPVAGERFGLIVCNPPYVISPDSRFIFRDGGRPRDSLCEEIIRTAPEYLEDGGFASVLCNWALAEGEEWSAPVRRWLDGSQCDSWLLFTGTQDPLSYAALWNRSRDRATYDEALARWTTYFAHAGIASIGLGAVIMRRAAQAPPWFRADPMPDRAITPASDLIQRIFSSQDYLQAIGDDTTLLAHAFRSVPDHRVQQTLSLAGDGSYSVDRADVQLSDGLPFRGAVDPYTVHLLARCDGHRTLNDIADELTERNGGAGSDVRAACAAIARRLVALGFLLPPSNWAIG